MVKILYFWASFCGPCKLFGPLLKSVLETELKDRAIELQKIDGDEEPEKVQEYVVRSFPTVIVLKDGVEVGRHGGLVPRAKLVGALTDALNKG